MPSSLSEIYSLTFVIGNITTKYARAGARVDVCVRVFVISLITRHRVPKLHIITLKIICRTLQRALEVTLTNTDPRKRAN